MFESWCIEHRHNPFTCFVKAILYVFQHTFESGPCILYIQSIFGSYISLPCWLEWRTVCPGQFYTSPGYWFHERYEAPTTTSLCVNPPPWKLALVQTALSSKPFKLLPDIDLKLLPLKTALLLALVSVKRVGDLTVLLVNPVYVQYPVPPQ